MLLSVILTLRPQDKLDDVTTLPKWWGRAAHAMLLAAIQKIDPSLAGKMHSDESLRPFTVSNLMGHVTPNTFNPDSTFRLRITSLREDVTNALLIGCSEGSFTPGSSIELDYIRFRVESVNPQLDSIRSGGNHPTVRSASNWGGITSYSDLSAVYLLNQSPPETSISLSFASPTCFKSQGKHVPLPLPELVFASLLKRWNGFASITFPLEFLEYVTNSIAISRYDLSSRVVEVKSGGLRMGAVGEVTYKCLEPDRYWVCLVNTLADYALYSGVGIGTTMGLGQVNRI
jgi:CRISPR-associated endoribonuclease Cas6